MAERTEIQNVGRVPISGKRTFPIFDIFPWAEYTKTNVFALFSFVDKWGMGQIRAGMLAWQHHGGGCLAKDRWSKLQGGCSTKDKAGARQDKMAGWENGKT